MPPPPKKTHTRFGFGAVLTKMNPDHCMYRNSAYSHATQKVCTKPMGLCSDRFSAYSQRKGFITLADFLVVLGPISSIFWV